MSSDNASSPTSARAKRPSHLGASRHDAPGSRGLSRRVLVAIVGLSALLFVAIAWIVGSSTPQKSGGGDGKPSLGTIESVRSVLEVKCPAAGRPGENLSCTLRLGGEGDELSLEHVISPRALADGRDGPDIEAIQVAYEWHQTAGERSRPECRLLPDDLMDYARVLWPESVEHGRIEAIIRKVHLVGAEDVDIDGDGEIDINIWFERYRLRAPDRASCAMGIR